MSTTRILPNTKQNGNHNGSGGNGHSHQLPVKTNGRVPISGLSPLVAPSINGDQTIADGTARTASSVRSDNPKGRREGVLSPLETYLRDAGAVPLLKPEEEVALAHRIRNGDKEAREHFIRANLRLGVKIARDYEHKGVPLLDLINEGNIGLMKAVDYFDPSKGAKFSTYGSWWIKQAITRAIANQGKIIRLPIHLRDNVHRMLRVSYQLEGENGVPPTVEEVAEVMGVSIGQVRKWKRAYETTNTVSLHEPRSDDPDAGALADTVADESAVAGNELAARSEQIRFMREFLEDLEPREAVILEKRFGLNGDGEQTLEEVGAQFNVTRERIRQLQEIALAKLRRKLTRVNRIEGE